MSAVHKYYRKISENVDNVKTSMEIASLLIKSQEVDLKIEDMENNDTEYDTKINKRNRNILLFNGNLTNFIDKSKNDFLNIGKNSTNIINNKSDIDNLNTKQVPDIITKLTNLEGSVNNLPTNLNDDIDKISVNQNNIQENYLSSQLNKSKTEYNLKLINNNINNIRAINSSITNIQNDINSIYTPVSNPKYILDNIFLFNLDFEKNISFTTDIKEILVNEVVIEDDFKKNSYLEVYESILYFFESLKTSYHILKERYEILDENDKILINFSFHPL